MSKTVTIPASVWNKVQQDLLEIKESLSIKDLVNEKQACEVLDIARNTLGKRIRAKKVIVESVSETGQKFFSEKKLKGIV